MNHIKIITTPEHALKDVARISKQYLRGKKTKATVRQIIVEIEGKDPDSCKVY